MATADQVKALIRSHADGDDTRFYAIAMQVAAQAARSGHGKFAVELRELVDQVKLRATDVMRGRLALRDTGKIDWRVAAKAAAGLSDAELALAYEQAAKNAVLDHETAVREAELTTALEERRGWSILRSRADTSHA